MTDLDKDALEAAAQFLRAQGFAPSDVNLPGLIHSYLAALPVSDVEGVVAELHNVDPWHGAPASLCDQAAALIASLAAGRGAMQARLSETARIALSNETQAIMNRDRAEALQAEVGRLREAGLAADTCLSVAYGMASDQGRSELRKHFAEVQASLRAALSGGQDA